MRSASRRDRCADGGTGPPRGFYPAGFDRTSSAGRSPKASRADLAAESLPVSAARCPGFCWPPFARFFTISLARREKHPSRTRGSLVQKLAVFGVLLFALASFVSAGAQPKSDAAPLKITPGKVIVPTERMRRIWGELISLDSA